MPRVHLEVAGEEGMVLPSRNNLVKIALKCDYFLSRTQFKLHQSGKCPGPGHNDRYLHKLIIYLVVQIASIRNQILDLSSAKDAGQNLNIHYRNFILFAV